MVFPIKAKAGKEDVASDEDKLVNPTWHYLNDFKVGFSLHNFSVLETLEIEQLVLYGPVFEEPDEVDNDRNCELVLTGELLAKFPPSLIHLRIGCIFY